MCFGTTTEEMIDVSECEVLNVLGTLVFAYPVRNILQGIKNCEV
jgi:hypothetical protein